ncbi:Hypothetical predicted protein, partial [Mytilus galloprovincialis]
TEGTPDNDMSHLEESTQQGTEAQRNCGLVQGSQEECIRNSIFSIDSGTIQVKSEIVYDDSDSSDFENSTENESLSENSYNIVAQSMPFSDNQNEKSMFMYSMSRDNEMNLVNKTDDMLTKHDKSTLKIKFHMCKECGKVCRSPWKLMTHIKSHNYRDQYECPECGVWPKKDNVKAKFIVPKKGDNLEIISKGDNSDTDVTENGGISELQKISMGDNSMNEIDERTVSVGKRSVARGGKSINLSEQRLNDSMTIDTIRSNNMADVIEFCKDKNVKIERNHGEEIPDDVSLRVEVENLLKKNEEINEKNMNSDGQNHLTNVKDAKNHPCPGPPEVKELASKKRRNNKRKNLRNKNVKTKSATGKYSSKTKKLKRKPKSTSDIKDSNLYIVNCETVTAFANKSKNTEELDNLPDEIQVLGNNTTDIIKKDDEVQYFPNFPNEFQDCLKNEFKYNEVQDYDIIKNVHEAKFGFDSTEETNTSDSFDIIIKTEILDTNYE